MDRLTIASLGELPDAMISSLDERLSGALRSLNKKIVVLDDDPTGTQTVHDICVYTNWELETVLQAFADSESMFFIMTNSRGFTAKTTEQAHAEIGRNLCKAAQETGEDFILISRSDSTLRGHFPLETETLRATIEQCSDRRFDGEILVPFFVEGGRYTINNIHYVREGEELIPAALTEFANDKSFGYKSSHLGKYVQEKTVGRFSERDCVFISIEDLRAGKVEEITRQLMAVQNFNKVIVNAASYEDIKVFILAYCEALQQGKTFMFRSAAAIPKVLGAVSDQPLLTRQQLRGENPNGGIVLVGSHVNKTTRQLECLRSGNQKLMFIEFDQHRVLEPGGLEDEVIRVVHAAETSIAKGTSVVVYTRRQRLDLDTEDKDAQLEISTRISDAVTSIVGSLSVRPSFIVAKGGITSSDVATKALGVKKAVVMGQVQPGIPVWLTGAESKYPGMPYIIFPGNVGQDDTMYVIVNTLAGDE